MKRASESWPASRKNLESREQSVPLQRMLISINISFNNKNKQGVLKGWKLCIIFTKHLKMFIKKNSGVSGVSWDQTSCVMFWCGWLSIPLDWRVKNLRALLRTIRITFNARTNISDGKELTKSDHATKQLSLFSSF